MDVPHVGLLDDRPLRDLKADRLGHADYARALADALVGMVPQRGLVVAINGPWGSGKSTVLSFLKQALMERDPSVIVCEFSPWVFSGRDDLLASYLAQLLSDIGKKSAKPLRRSLGKLIRLTGTLSGKEHLERLGSLVEGTAPSLLELKAEADKALSSLGRRIFVLLDDVDRLRAEEIRSLFQMVKAVADFSNVVYILAFDHDVVASALDPDMARGSGYLDKIVQLPRTVPPIERSDLLDLLLERLQRSLGPDDMPDADDRRWVTIARRGIMPSLRTPRDVVRILNQVTLLASGNGEELNPVDMIALETLHVVAPDVYETVRCEQKRFVSSMQNVIDGRWNEGVHQAFHNAWIARVSSEHAEPVGVLVGSLFPEVRAYLQGSGLPAEPGAVGKRECRVCEPEYFPLYFRLSLPGGFVSRADRAALLQATGNARDLVSLLTEAAERGGGEAERRIRRYLEHLEECASDQIPLCAHRAVTAGLIQVGDLLADRVPGASGPWARNVPSKIAGILVRLLQRVTLDERAGCLLAAIKGCDSVSTAVEVTVSFTHDHGPQPFSGEVPEQERFVSTSAADALMGLAVEKIREAARSARLLPRADLVSILFRWRDWSGEAEPRAWLWEAMHDECQLPTLLERLLQEVQVAQGDSQWTTPTMMLDQLAVLTDPIALAERSSALDRTTLTARQALAADTLLSELGKRTVPPGEPEGPSRPELEEDASQRTHDE